MNVRILILFTCLFIGCTTKSPTRNNTKELEIVKQFDGNLIDVNADESLILYEIPKDSSSEFTKAKLICHQIATNNEIIISDSIVYYGDLHAKFFNDTIVIVPTDKDIWLYNLKQQKYFENLTNLKPDEYVFTFNISKDKQTIAFIVGIQKEEHKFKTYYLDLKTKTLIKDDFTITDNSVEDWIYCSIYIINNHILFSIDNNL